MGDLSAEESPGALAALETELGQPASLVHPASFHSSMVLRNHIVKEGRIEPIQPTSSPPRAGVRDRRIGCPKPVPHGGSFVHYGHFPRLQSPIHELLPFP